MKKNTGFRVIDEYARGIMGKKSLFPAPENITGADAIIATLIFNEGACP